MKPQTSVMVLAKTGKNHSSQCGINYPILLAADIYSPMEYPQMLNTPMGLRKLTLIVCSDTLKSRLVLNGTKIPEEKDHSSFLDQPLLDKVNMDLTGLEITSLRTSTMVPRSLE
jgi:hypothetical protein